MDWRCAKKDILFMPSRLFEQYLIEKGYITREMSLKVAERESTVDQHLFAVAISKGCLSEEQLSQIDAAGRDHTTSALEQAIRAGMLTPDQIEEFRKVPAQPSVFLGEALIKKGFMTPIQFSRAYAGFQREFPQPRHIRYKLPTNISPSHRSIVVAFLEAFVDTFIHYSKHDLRVASTSTELPKYDHTHMWTFLQKVYTNGYFHIIMSIPEPIMRTTGAEMLRCEVTTVDDTVVDALSKLFNVFIGKACTKLNEAGLSLSTTQPAVTHGVRTYPARPNKVVTLNVETMKDCLTLVFAFTDAP
jgi:hypothetical protein